MKIKGPIDKIRNAINERLGRVEKQGKESGNEQPINEHLIQMEGDLYFELFEKELRIKAKRGGPLESRINVAQAETIEDLRQLNLTNPDIDNLGIYSEIKHFFDYEQGSVIGINCPAFVHIKQFKENLHSPTGYNPAVLAVLDHAHGPVYDVHKNALRLALLHELGSEIRTHSPQIIEFDTNWKSTGSFNTLANKYIVIPSIIFSTKDAFSSKYDNLFAENMQDLKNLIEVAEKYTHISKSRQFDQQESHLRDLYSGIAKIFIHSDYLEDAERILQGFKSYNITK